MGTTTGGIDIDTAMERVLLKLLGGHTCSEHGPNSGFTGQLYLLYPQPGGKLVPREANIEMAHWLLGKLPLEDELNEFTAALTTGVTSQRIRGLLVPGFTGVALVINAVQRPDAQCTLGDYSKLMLVGTVMMLDGPEKVAVYAEGACNFIRDEQAVLWDSDALRQLLFALDDLQREQLDPHYVRTPRRDVRRGGGMAYGASLLPDSAVGLKNRMEAIL